MTESNKIVEIKVRSNGSCGPNSLGVIFCSYLLSDQFEDSPESSKLLREFSLYWNLYFCENEPGHQDYIKSDPQNSLPLISNIKEKVKGKLEVMGSRFRVYRSEHMQQLIAPLLRFSYLLHKDFQKDDEPQQSPFAHNDDKDLKEKAKGIKTQMRDSKETLDNSPNYHSYFDQYSMHFVSQLLGLFAIYKTPDYFTNEAEVEKELLENNTIKKDNQRLYCFISNQSRHYNPLLPVYIQNDKEVKEYFGVSEVKCEEFISDEEAYQYHGEAPSHLVGRDQKTTTKRLEAGTASHNTQDVLKSKTSHQGSYLKSIIGNASFILLMMGLLVIPMVGFGIMSIGLGAGVAMGAGIIFSANMAHKYIDLGAKGSKPVPAGQLSTVPQSQLMRDDPVHGVCEESLRKKMMDYPNSMPPSMPYSSQIS